MCCLGRAERNNQWVHRHLKQRDATTEHEQCGEKGTKRARISRRQEKQARACHNRKAQHDPAKITQPLHQQPGRN